MFDQINGEEECNSNILWQRCGNLNFIALLHRVPPRYLHERIGGFLRPYNGTISGSISVVFT
jgi:hypothetical protein